ncbi:MAG: hypothetical protein H7281_15675 [Bacteriovorax sp.]|nr:hypothetical protein [Bacteriovorax sp.]
MIFSPSINFHLKNALFSFKESWTNLANSIVGFMLFPVFMFVLSKMWQKFNGYMGNYTYKEMLAYIGVTEILFMTFLRTGNVQAASSDFSISLARPRSWLATQYSALYGKTLGSRLVLTTLLLPLLILFGLEFHFSLNVIFRLLLFLIPLGIFQALYSLIFSCAHVRFEVTNYLTLPFGKLFLIFGGVFAPISDFSEPARNLLLKLPPSDLFFQPAYYTIKGTFYHLTFAQWASRLTIQLIILLIINIWFFKSSRRHHQSFGG